MTNLNRKVIVRFNNFEKEGIIKAERKGKDGVMFYNVHHKHSVSIVTDKHLTYL